MLCPLCNQYIDYIATTYSKEPFIDGKCYKVMCFTCANVPAEYHKDEKVFSYRYLHSAQDLYELGSADTLQQARVSVKAVKKRIKSLSSKRLDKLNLTRPQSSYKFNIEYEEKLRKKWKIKK